MELTFTYDSTMYVAEFQASSDFNLHIEKGEGSVVLYQTTVEGSKYDVVKTIAEYYDKVIDIDFVGTVYPKYIKVESSVLPTMAEVTFA